MRRARVIQTSGASATYRLPSPGLAATPAFDRLTYRGVGLSTRAGLVLGIIEIAIFLLISTLLIVNAQNNTLSVFVPGEAGS